MITLHKICCGCNPLYDKKEGFKNVFAITDPWIALEHFRINHKDYSLIVSDIRMPNTNEFEFVETSRKINPKVKILLMTAFEIHDKEFLGYYLNHR